MKRRTLIAPFTAILLSVGTLASQTLKTPIPKTIPQRTHPVTPEDILGIRDLGHEIKLSPDGRQVAFVITEPANAKLPRAPSSSNIWIVPSELFLPLDDNVDNVMVLSGVVINGQLLVTAEASVTVIFGHTSDV